MGSDLFIRNVKGMTETLKGKCIGVAGCGGLGSNAAVALTRSGVGKLILVDFDRIEESNLNRQYYFQDDIGKVKSDTLAGMLKRINPAIDLEVHNVRVDESNVEPLFGKADLLVEAFDKAESKKMLIEKWATLYPKKPVVCGSGLSGLGATSDLKVHRAGNIYLCGDEISEMTLGLCASRVAIAANMQANVAIDLLINGKLTTLK